MLAARKGGEMLNESVHRYQPCRRPKRKPLPDLRNEKTYERVMKVAEREVRESRMIRFVQMLRLRRI